MTTKAATDALLAALNIAPEIPEGRGFTVRDVMRNHDKAYGQASRAIEKAIALKLYREIGIRRNSHGMKVYEVVKSKK